MNNITFDVLTQPWIPVRMLDGSVRELGLYELLENAHNIGELTETSPLIRYGIMRLLVAFVTDAFRPVSRNDLLALIDAGSFDMKKISEYVSTCKKEMGNGCFDLFDDKRPFLQSAYDERYDRSEEHGYKSVAILMREMPKGTSHVHFVHNTEDEHEYCPSVCVRGLCAVNVFALAGGQGYSTGINGGFPPWFVLVRRDTLFESVLANTLCERQIENSNLEKNIYEPPVVWRDGKVVVPKELIPATSYLRGLTWTARRISLLPIAKTGICTYSGKETDVLISKIRYTWGWNCNEIKEHWRDPHVGYNTNKKGEEKAIKPASGSSAWRDLGGLVFKLNSVPAVVKQYIDIIKKKDENLHNIELNLFGMTTDGKEKVHEWFSETFNLKFDVIYSLDKSREVIFVLQKMEKVAYILKKQLNSVFLGMLNYKGKSKVRMLEKSSFLSQVQVEFFSQMREYFFNSFLPQLAEMNMKNEDWVIKLHESVNKTVWVKTMSVFNRFSQLLGIDAPTMVAMVEAEKWLRIELSKVLPKEEG